MTYIKVNHSKLESSASSIEKYISKHKNMMKSIQSEVTLLGASWQGKDYNQAKIEMEELNSSDSISSKMIKSLESYTDFLRFATKEYKAAQSRAINKANKLPK